MADEIQAPERSDSPSALPSPRQTRSFIRQVLAAYGLEPKNKLGQNYLIDLNLIDLIARVAEVSQADAVLEVGTGTGSLTARLARDAGAVVTIEIDPAFSRVAESIVGKRPNVRFLTGDCLARKSSLNPAMLQAWTEAASQPGILQRKLVANLPYVIATPLISNLLCQEFIIEQIVVMVQWEVAERITAQVNTKAYNAFSVLVQSVADAEIVRKVGPTNFYPQPAVDSAIVLIRHDAQKRSRIQNLPAFRDFLRDLFAHRRKNLRGALAGSARLGLSKLEVDQVLQRLGLHGSLRAESLDPDMLLRLHSALAR